MNTVPRRVLTRHSTGELVSPAPHLEQSLECRSRSRGRGPLSRRAVAPRDRAGARNLGKQRGRAPHRARRTRTPHRRIDMNADTDGTALTNAWLYPAETDAIDDLLGIRPAGRRVATHGFRHGERIRRCRAARSARGVEALDAFVWGFAMLWFTGIALQFCADNRRGLWRRPVNRRATWISPSSGFVAARRVHFAWLR